MNVSCHAVTIHVYRLCLFLLCCCQQTRALALATIAAGEPFVKQANLISGLIVLFSTAPNGDTAPPTPRGHALTPPHPTQSPFLSSLISKRRLCHNVPLWQLNLIVTTEFLWVAKVSFTWLIKSHQLLGPSFGESTNSLCVFPTFDILLHPFPSVFQQMKASSPSPFVQLWR